ncbi:uncharacterized protein LOC108679347 [Hyalella azteca]|uniref:Uncharacterized protein LOC108679347 n=1 Tax=Hyalella azteca TaxID=294128 RepID=A0A8B7PBR7_HYAAZ|nr:uncharacterized protein LOC108679347 [Hyalella azteca]
MLPTSKTKISGNDTSLAPAGDEVLLSNNPKSTTPKSDRRKKKGSKNVATSAISQQLQMDNLIVSSELSANSLPLKADRYNGLVTTGRKKILSRKELRALQASKDVSSGHEEGLTLAAGKNGDRLLVGGERPGGGTPARACSTPKESQPSSTRRKVKFNVENSCLLTKSKSQQITGVLVKSVQLFFSLSKSWTKNKREGRISLQNFVGLKIDNEGRIAKELDYRAMIYLTDFSDVINSMVQICDSMKDSLQSIKNLGVSREVAVTFKPFDVQPFSTIVCTLVDCYKRYCNDYDYKRAACTKLMNACFHEDDSEDCIRQLNNIVNIWTSDVHLNNINTHIIALYVQIDGLGL